MSRLVSISFVAMTTMLVAACQQMPGSRVGDPGAPPAAQRAASGASAQAAAPAPAPAQASRAPAVEFRLAQPETDKGLQPLKLGDRQLWVLPQPVLTRADLQSVVAVKGRDGRSYVRFQLTQAAAPRLAELSQRFRGKYLLLSIDGQLASAPTIGGPMKDGLLFVPVVNEQQAARVAAAVAGAQAPAAR